MDDILRKLQAVVRKKLSDPVATRRPQLEALQSRIRQIRPKFRDAESNRNTLYWEVAVLLILIDQAGLLG